ncbi:hypothetical protein Hdeb2414_s0051g00751741 [Helianthus debilis subsp. tardiflorus]
MLRLETPKPYFAPSKLDAQQQEPPVVISSTPCYLFPSSLRVVDVMIIFVYMAAFLVCLNDHVDFRVYLIISMHEILIGCSFLPFGYA